MLGADLRTERSLAVSTHARLAFTRFTASRRYQVLPIVFASNIPLEATSVGTNVLAAVVVDVLLAITVNMLVPHSHDDTVLASGFEAALEVRDQRTVCWMVRRRIAVAVTIAVPADGSRPSTACDEPARQKNNHDPRRSAIHDLPIEVMCSMELYREASAASNPTRYHLHRKQQEEP